MEDVSSKEEETLLIYSLTISSRWSIFPHCRYNRQTGRHNRPGSANGSIDQGDAISAAGTTGQPTSGTTDCCFKTTRANTERLALARRY